MIDPKISPVYNVGDFGEDIFLPFELGADGTTAFSATSITISAAATELLQYTEDSTDREFAQIPTAGTNLTPIDETDILIMSNDTVGLVYSANDTAFNRTFTWTPDMNAFIYKTSLILGAACNASAVSGGATVDIGTIQFGAIERNTGRVLIPMQTVPQINTQLTATGTSIAILQTDWVQFYEVFAKSPIDITIKVNSSKVAGGGAATFQSGFLPIFPYNKLNVMKGWSHSGIGFHVHATPNHADPVFQVYPNRIVGT